MDIDKLIQEVSEEITSDCSIAAHRYGWIDLTCTDVIGKLEHSMLTPDLTDVVVTDACNQARKYHIAALCLPPYYVPLATGLLRGSGVAVCSALGVPNALFSAKARLTDAKYSVLNGANELDVSINAMAVKSGHFADAESDLADIVRAARGKAYVKAAVELSLFDETEKKAVLSMAVRSGVTYIKIQNVLSGKGADTVDIRYVREIVGRNVGIKIDGGVKTYAQARELISGGANRIGLTATFEIAEETTI